MDSLHEFDGLMITVELNISNAKEIDFFPQKPHYCWNSVSVSFLHDTRKEYNGIVLAIV